MTTMMSLPLQVSPANIPSYQLNWTPTDSRTAVQINTGRLRSWNRVVGWILCVVFIVTVSWVRFSGWQHRNERNFSTSSNTANSYSSNFFLAFNSQNHPIVPNNKLENDQLQSAVGISRHRDAIINDDEADDVGPIVVPPSNVLVQPEDYVYLRTQWDAAPIVIEKYKLIFFTVPKSGSTVWKLLFRRIMGYANWQTVDWSTMLPHHPERNGLKYLYDYSMEEASAMLESPQYTKAIFVRDPKERLLSAYLDKALRNYGDYIRSKCCYLFGRCVPDAQESLEGFLNLTASCDDVHWRPQGKRMEPKYWPYLTFVGHLESAQDDAKRLLQSLSDGKTTAWSLYGMNGWGPYGNQSMFDSSDGRDHDTNADSQLSDYYTSLRFEQRVEQFYQSDYNNRLLNIPLTRINH